MIAAGLSSLPSFLHAARRDRLPARGVCWTTAKTGGRYGDRDDFACARFLPGTMAAGVFTQSTTAAAPVFWCRSALAASGEARALLVNAGVANAFAGAAGMAALRRLTAAAARRFGCREIETMTASTGVIGEALDAAPLIAALPPGGAIVDADAAAWTRAAAAMMTTDTTPKYAALDAEIDGVPTAIDGIAKGSGMMAPNMATMLAFIVTDAAIGAKALQIMLAEAVKGSFNAVTVDGDASTNDTLLVFATGAAGGERIDDPDDRRLLAWRAAFGRLTSDLAQGLLRDGEGVERILRVEIDGAQNDEAARLMARSVAESPLVKTAFSGARVNWGRIVMAVGKAAARCDATRMGVEIGGVAVARDGAGTPHDADAVAAHCRGDEIGIRVTLGDGSGRAIVYGCDLTVDYVRINADYLT